MAAYSKSEYAMFDTSMLKIAFAGKGNGLIGRQWRGQSFHESFARLYYIYAGEAKIRHHQQTFKLLPEHLYLVPPKSNMHYCCRDQFGVIWVHFNISVYGHLDLFSMPGYGMMRVPDMKENVVEKLLEITELMDLSDVFSQLRARSLLLELVADFFRLNVVSSTKTVQHLLTRLAPVLDHVDQHLDRRITLSELAEVAAYEKTYFSKLFKRVFEISPAVYVQNRRVEKAKAMLQDSAATLATVAEALGYTDAFHFSRVFKKVTGESPSHYRKRLPMQQP